METGALDPPGGICTLKLPSLTVAVCGAEVWLLQVTVSPGWAVWDCGENANPDDPLTTDTVTAAAAASLRAATTTRTANSPASSPAAGPATSRGAVAR